MEKEMRVLVACETSGIVRDAFMWAGMDAYSCDLLESDTPTNRHIVGDAREVIARGDWDLLMVAHPPCTRLCNSGVRWLHKAPPGRTLADMSPTRAAASNGAPNGPIAWGARGCLAWAPTTVRVV